MDKYEQNNVHTFVWSPIVKGMGIDVKKYMNSNRAGYMIFIALLVNCMFIVVLLGACNGGEGQPQSTTQPQTSVRETTKPIVLTTKAVESTTMTTTYISPEELTVEFQWELDEGVEWDEDGNETDYLSDEELPDSYPCEVLISFEYTRQSGSASNQYAVWIEDMDGNMVRTLYATRYTANGGYKNRPDSLAVWVAKSGLASMSKSEVDAITSATPRAGMQNYSWDLTDANGVPVPLGEYRFFVEGTLRWKNYAIYSGVIDIDIDYPISIQADAEFVYVESGLNAALTEDSPENDMLIRVTATFLPAY